MLYVIVKVAFYRSHGGRGRVQPSRQYRNTVVVPEQADAILCRTRCECKYPQAMALFDRRHRGDPISVYKHL